MCRGCGGGSISLDANCYWNPRTQKMELGDWEDCEAWCNDCDDSIGRHWDFKLFDQWYLFEEAESE